MPKLLHLFFFLSLMNFSSVSIAQDFNQATIDSLVIASRENPNESIKQLRMMFMRNPLPESESYLLESTRLLNDKDTLLNYQVYLQLGILALRQNKFDKAKEYYTIMLNTVKEDQDKYPEKMIQGTAAMADLYYSKHELDTSMEYFNEVERLSDQYSSKQIYKAYTGRAWLYNELGNRDLFYQEIDKVIDYFERYPNESQKGYVLYTVIRNIYYSKEWEEYNNYFPYFFKHYENKVYSAPEGHVPLENFMGNEDVSETINNLEEVLANLEPTNDIVNVGTTRLLAKKYLKANLPSKAINLLERYLDENPQANRSFSHMIYFTLYQTHKELGNYNVSLDYLEQYIERKNELITEQEQDNLNELAVKYETDKKEQELAIQSLQLQKANRSKIFLITGLIGLSLLSGLLYKLFQSRKKTASILSDKNNKIEAALNEKETLLREIHHRVKNNLQVVSSLLSLQSRGLTDEQAKEAMSDSRNRVQSMALIHQNLYQDKDLVGVNTKEYIEKLTSNLVQNYSLQKVEVETDIDNLDLDVDIMIPLGLILNELITNSLKYAFKEQDSGKIQIHLKQQAAGLQLQVSDNGKGLPAEFNHTKLESLGFRLIDAFTKKLKATMKIERPKTGTKINILIPKTSLVA